MATTTNGAPYPIGTDRVMDGDNAIQALAQFLDDKLFCFASVYKTANGGPYGAITNNWFTDLTTLKAVGGMVTSATGITVPIKGVYHITGIISATGSQTNTGINQMIGDGASGIWSYAGAVTAGGGAHAVTAMGHCAVLLNAGQKISWGIAVGGIGGTGSVLGADPNRCLLTARLVVPVP